MLDFVIRYWLEVLFAGIVSAVGLVVRLLYKQVKGDRVEQSLIKNGLLAILHDRLYILCNQLLEQGYCSVEDMKNLEHLHEGYSALGGNGTGTELI